MIVTDGEPTIATGIASGLDHTVTGPFVGDSFTASDGVSVRVVGIKPDANFPVHAVAANGDHYLFTYQEVDTLRG